MLRVIFNEFFGNPIEDNDIEDVEYEDITPPRVIEETYEEYIIPPRKP